MLKCISIFTDLCVHPSLERTLVDARVGIHTILPLPILYGAWHTKGGSVGGRILRNGRATVLQSGRRCKWVGAIQGSWTRTIKL